MPRKKAGIIITHVFSKSPAEAMGLAAGDFCVKLNGHRIEDFLDFQFYTKETGSNLMHVIKPGGNELIVDFELEPGEALGVEWGPIAPRTCKNKCIFCFVDQLPPGVRRTLKIKDEDYRHSFLFGNFITLSNFTPSDVQRIIDQRLSPLYVSVHTTNPELRRRMVGCLRQDQFFEYFNALANGGITLQTQIVLCPGINDGTELDRTLRDLAQSYPAVRSVGVVPVGLTRFRGNLSKLKPVNVDIARDLISQVTQLQQYFYNQYGLRFVYLADEFYLMAGQPLPPAAAYDDFPQFENGIGMTRDFLDRFERIIRKKQLDLTVEHATFVTGRLFAPLLDRCLKRFNAKFRTRLESVSVENRFLGPQVTVAGLLAGQDIAEQAKGKKLGSFVGVPFYCLNGPQGVFLDDLTMDDLARSIGCPVIQLQPGANGFLFAVTRHSVKRISKIP